MKTSAKTNLLFIALCVLISPLSIQSCKNQSTPIGSSQNSKTSTFITDVKLDQELTNEDEKAINSSTQSINRYSSNLRALNKVGLSHDHGKKKLNLSFKDENTASFLNINNIDLEFICPQLPYPDIKSDAFDIANLILAEYSRNGIGIPIQESNELYASVNVSDDIFNNKGEYIFTDGNYQPNPGVLPKRISVVNNCLRPGLWEFNASDAVGEMYHAWFELDQDFYFEIIENQTGINKELIPKDFNDSKYFDNVSLHLDRLRSLEAQVGEYEIQYNGDKVFGSYSTQDSRRKVQRKFYHIERDNKIIPISKQSEMKEGDKYSMFSFQEPGIYDPNNRMKLDFKREWNNAKIFRSIPKTQYSDKQEFPPSEYLEMHIFNEEDGKAIIIGNIPMSLLSLKNDFVIPSFGAGVLQASERIERRLLRTTVGPHPSFAYLAEKKEENEFNVINNHLYGYEQIFLRPIEKGEDMFLRVTLVSYERITDLLEFEIKINNLKNEILQNNASYSPPIYETYQDDNTL